MKWAGMYLVGFIILIGGILAALWKLGILANIGTTWTVIGVVILIGFGIMIAVSNSGSKENIQTGTKCCTARPDPADTVCRAGKSCRIGGNASV